MENLCSSGAHETPWRNVAGTWSSEDVRPLCGSFWIPQRGMEPTSESPRARSPATPEVLELVVPQQSPGRGRGHRCHAPATR